MLAMKLAFLVYDTYTSQLAVHPPIGVFYAKMCHTSFAVSLVFFRCYVEKREPT